MKEFDTKWMQASQERDCLRLVFPERISSSNAAEIREEVVGLCAGFPHTELVADFRDVEYISSSGLRVILELIRSEKSFRIINVGTTAYEVFDMTGFLQMADIRKKRRQISLDGAEEIGWGFTARVYRLTEDSIIKVYREDIPVEDIEGELNHAKQAFIAGIPTAISFDIVDVGNSIGVIFERMDGGTLQSAMLAEPERFEELMARYVRVLQSINSIEVLDKAIPDAKEIVREKLKYLSEERGILSPQEAERMESFLSSLPDTGTYIHGDCQFKNIMLSAGEPMLIDMDTLSKGSPLFELAALFSCYIVFEEVFPGNTTDFFNVSRELTERIMEYLMNACLPVYSKEPFERAEKKVRLLGTLTCFYTIARFMPEKEEGLKRVTALFRKRLAELET